MTKDNEATVSSLAQQVLYPTRVNAAMATIGSIVHGFVTTGNKEAATVVLTGEWIDAPAVPVEIRPWLREGLEKFLEYYERKTKGTT